MSALIRRQIGRLKGMSGRTRKVLNGLACPLGLAIGLALGVLMTTIGMY